MKLTREEALRLHRQMWTDMQTALGDNPSWVERIAFKEAWCKKHFPDEKIESNCSLCEYGVQYSEYVCDYCPIRWDERDDYDGCTDYGTNYLSSPISEILALPEREDEDEISNN